MIKNGLGFVKDNLLVAVLVATLVLGAGVYSFSFADRYNTQEMECETVTDQYDVRCSDVDNYLRNLQGVSSENTTFWIKLYSIKDGVQPAEGEPVHTPFLYHNGYKASDDIGSSLGPEDLEINQSVLDRLAEGSKCTYQGVPENRDDDVFITTSQGDFTFDNDPSDPGEQHVSELDLGVASVESDEIRMTSDGVYCRFDFYDIAKQSVEAGYPGEFESLDSYGAWIFRGTVSVDFGFPEPEAPRGSDPVEDPVDDGGESGVGLFEGLWVWFTSLF